MFANGLAHFSVGCAPPADNCGEKQLGRIRNVRSETIWCCKWNNSIEVCWIFVSFWFILCFFFRSLLLGIETLGNGNSSWRWLRIFMACLAANHNWIRSSTTHSWPNIRLLSPFIMDSIISRACFQYLSHNPYPVSVSGSVPPVNTCPRPPLTHFCWGQLNHFRITGNRSPKTDPLKDNKVQY